MAVRSRIDPINRDIELFLTEDLGPAARAAALADYARDQLAEAQATNRAALGYAPGHDTYVDGRRETNLNTVRPDGVITFDFDLLNDLFGWIDLQLVKHSPVKDGDYRRSHLLLADGVAIDPNGMIPEAREYVYINTQPYARKIERGLSNQAPDGVYQVVAELAKRRFGNIAQIRFSYRVPLFGEIDAWAAKTKMQRAERPGLKGERRAEWLRRQPAIVITRRS